MKRLSTQIGLFIAVTFLIAATGGFSVYQHICHCAGEMSVSVFTEADCNQADGSYSCCKTDKHASCCAEKPVNHHKHSVHGKDCCQNSVMFFKITDSYQAGIEKISIKPVFVETPLVIFDLSENNLQPSIFNLQSYNLPPPDAGRQMLVALHQLKLDTYLV